MPKARKEMANLVAVELAERGFTDKEEEPEAKEAARRTRGPQEEAHVEDLEAGDVQNPDEGGALPLGLVQGLVDAQHQPAEHALVGGLGQGLDGKVSLRGGTPGDSASDTGSL